MCKESMSNNKSLPPVEDWPHRPVFVTASDETHILNNDKMVPLGIPFDFESSLFQGRMLLRLRNAPSDDPVGNQEYFSGRARLCQFIVQGRFKRRLAMSDVYAGTVYHAPLLAAPPEFAMKVVRKIVQRNCPGVIMDLTSDEPKVLNLFAGMVQAIRIDKPGEEPDISSLKIEDNFGQAIGQTFRSIKERKKIMSVPKHAAKGFFETNLVYTFDQFDHIMDFANNTMKISPFGGSLSLERVIGPQPNNWCAVTATGEQLFHFDFWHEGTLSE